MKSKETAQFHIVGYIVTEKGNLTEWSTPREQVMLSIRHMLGVDFRYDVIQNVHGDFIEIYYGVLGARNRRVEGKTGRIYRGPVVILKRSAMLPKPGYFKSFTSFRGGATMEGEFEYYMRFDLTDQFEEPYAFLTKTGDMSVKQEPCGGDPQTERD